MSSNLQRRVLFSLIAAWACTASATNATNINPNIAKSEGVKVSSTISTNSEIERLSGEVKSQRVKADFWDRWNIRFLFIAGFAAICLVITAIGVSRSNGKLTDLRDELDRAKDRALQTDLKTKEDEIALLNNASASARLEIAQANERTANLEKEAEFARHDTEKLKQIVGWRTISSQTTADLEIALAVAPGAVNLRYTDGDPEALFLAIQFSRILEKAKWKVAPGSIKFANAIQFGIVLPDAIGVDATTLRNAFSTAKIGYSTNQLPPPTAMFSVMKIDGAPVLMIGSKPLTPLQ